MTDSTAKSAGDAAGDTTALPDQSAMTVEDLARAVLDRQIKRPRITSMRRLAEALLAKKAKKAAKKAAKKDKKVRKLAKIPGQKGR